MKMQWLGVGLPARYGVQALYECGGERVYRVPDCKKRIINRIETVLPTKYGNFGLRSLL